QFGHAQGRRGNTMSVTEFIAGVKASIRPRARAAWKPAVLLELLTRPLRGFNSATPKGGVETAGSRGGAGGCRTGASIRPRPRAAWKPSAVDRMKLAQVLLQ